MMLRVYSGEQKGATAFFRNRALLNTVCSLLAGQSPRVLFHAASIGAEPYSFAIYCAIRGIHCQCIHATDINSDFLQMAQKAEYPAAIAAMMLAEEKRFFDSRGEILSPAKEIRDAVELLPPCSFVDSSFSELYDAVFLTNALTYVTPEQQSRAIDNIAGYNTRLLIVTSFHPASTKADMLRNGYVPVGDNREAIHNSWGDRLVADAPADHSWMLPAYSEIPDYEYKFCAIFRKE